MKRGRHQNVSWSWLTWSLALMASGAPAGAQAPADEPVSAKIWVGRAQEFEEFLASAELDRVEEIPVGVTKPQRGYFVAGGLLESMSFKGIQPGRYNGFWESYRSEIAAYELDKLLELQMIPPTVEKRVEGSLGAAVMWVKPIKSFKEMGGPPTPPPVHAARWNKQIIRAKMFDCLIYNKDPNLGNWLVDPAWNLLLIDHTRSFTADKKMAHKLQRIDSELWQRMKALTEEQLIQALDKWLDKRAIRGMLARRDMMQAEIDKLVAANGEAAVFVQ
jgi:hypothetical protein